MEKEDKESYKSESILGKLYRYVTETDNARPHIADKIFDEDLKVAGFDRYLDEAVRYKKQYDSKLATLMDHYGFRNEEDIISGNIASMSNFVGGNKRKGDIRETILSAVKFLRKEARRWFEDNIDTDKQSTLRHMLGIMSHTIQVTGVREIIMSQMITVVRRK